MLFHVFQAIYLYKRSVCIRTEGMHNYFKLYINGNKINQVSSTKFLGVTIDENLTWLPHIENLKKKLVSCHGTLYRIKDLIQKCQYKNVTINVTMSGNYIKELY